MTNTKILASEFEHLELATVREAVSLLDKYDSEAQVLAGGTDLIVKMKGGLITPRYLLNINKIKELDFITEDEELRIGAATKLRKIERSDLV